MNTSLYQVLFKKSSIAQCLLDTGSLSILDTNTAFLDILQYDPQNGNGQSLYKYLGLETKVLEKYIAEVRAGHISSFTCVMKFVRNDGSSFWGNFDFVLINEHQVALAAIVDISEHKLSEHQLEDSESKYRQLFDHSLNAIGIYDIRKHHYIDCNKRFTEIYGYEKLDLNQISALDITWDVGDRNVYALRYQDNIDRLIKGETVSFESSHKSKDGKQIYVEVVLIPFFRNETMFIKQVTTDVTQKIVARQALKAKMEELQAMNKELENFAYVTSHDLKEPLISIISFAKLLKRNLGNTDRKEQEKYLDYVINAGSKLSGLITDILQYSLVNYESITFEPIVTSYLIKEILDDLGPLIEESGAIIKVERGMPEIIQGNRTYLYLLFQNLIKNAIKYRDDQRRPEINLGYQSQEESHLFSVQDNGIGISQEVFEDIFTIFSQANRTSVNKGSGIGLAICKKVAEIHHGKIWLDSTPNVGSQFTFSISKSL